MIRMCNLDILMSLKEKEEENQCVFYFYSEKIIRKIPEKKKAN